MHIDIVIACLSKTISLARRPPPSILFGSEMISEGCRPMPRRDGNRFELGWRTRDKWEARTWDLWDEREAEDAVKAWSDRTSSL